MRNTNLAESITAELGGEWRGRFGLCPGPGHSKRDRSLKIAPHQDDPNDLFVHSFAGDDVLALKAEWRERGLLPRNGRSGPIDRPRVNKAKVEKKERDVEDDTNKARAISWLYGQRHPASGTVVKKYLANRGIDIVPPTIGCLPPNPPKYPWPTMITALGLPDEPEPGTYNLPLDRVSAVSLTYLRPDGSGKADVDPQRRIIGKPLGSPIALIPPIDGLGLLIAEGVETALSGHLATGLGCWAAGSASFLPALADAVPSFIECVTIAAEADPAGRRGAEELACRLDARGIETIMLEV